LHLYYFTEKPPEVKEGLIELIIYTFLKVIKHL
jgi:hypothetical protein